MMQAMMPGNEVGSAAADPGRSHGFLHGSNQGRMVGETEIIVAAKRQQRLPVHLDAHPLRRVQCPSPAQQTLRGARIQIALQRLKRH